MTTTPPLLRLLLVLLAVLTLSARADTFVIPFSDIRQAIDTSGDDPDAVIRAYLAGLIRSELDARGFDVDGGLVFSEIPVDAITTTIQTDCDFPQPYKVHTDATTAIVALDDSSSLTIALDSIRSIDLIANLTGEIDADARAWVRWGQDVPFVGDCKTINTDNGWVGLTLPFSIDMSLMLDLEPTYDPDQVAIVIGKHALLAGQAQFNGGNLRHEFGPISITDNVLDIFEDELLEALHENGSAAVESAIDRLNYRLDGLDENGMPDPTIEAFNAPSTFVLDVDEADKAFIRDLLAELGIPEIVLAMVDDRGVEILLQLILLDGAERDAYLAGLGAEVGCEAILGTYLTPMNRTTVYTLDDQQCEIADLSTAGTGGYFSDAQCNNEIAFSVTDDTEFCLAQFDPLSETLLGNAASWAPDTNQPNDELPGVASRNWTSVPGTALDLFTVSIQGNHQPYMKQLNYKAIADVPRGSGVCELEMRVYKRDIAEQSLKPLLAIHGGTWQHRGSSFIGLEASASQFTERGFVVFAPFYRLAGEKDGNVECNGASWREATADIESALDWVQQNGTALGAGSDPVSVFGQSAGAHLAGWLAAHRGNEIRKALLYYGPTDVLEYLAGAVPAGGPYESYRNFGLRALRNLYGADDSSAELQLEQINFAGLTVELLGSDWSTLIPDTVFDLSLIDPLTPPVYLARCAAATQTDLAAINLSAPPAALTQCLKQDLSEFLIANSFHHQLGADEVPVYAVHGSGDTIVPHAQSVNLCAAIDDTVLPVDVVDPLTSYSCGTWSESHIIRDAEHAFDLGVCFGPLCPAGDAGSEIRGAANAAISGSYAWLQRDPAPDTDGDGIADDVDTDDDNDGIPDQWEIDNGLDPLDPDDAFLDNDVDGVTNLDEFLTGTDPNSVDTDSDGAMDSSDNCAATTNPGQEDADRDGVGNVCDTTNGLAPFDYDGDGESDILWQNMTSGEVSYWQMNGATLTSNTNIATLGNLDWQIVGNGDRNSDGKTDILWRNSATGEMAVWLMNGATITANLGLPTVSNQDWQVVGNGDYNGDGDADILWRNVANGQNAMWLISGGALMANLSVTSVGNLDWSVASSGDFDGDGNADILWRNGVTGSNALWLMNGAYLVANKGVAAVSNTDWQIQRDGDYNGDGTADLLWRNAASGHNAVWLMNGSARIANVGLPQISDTNMLVVGDGDYDGNGSADILWRNVVTGQNTIHQMSNGRVFATPALETRGTDWQVVTVD